MRHPNFLRALGAGIHWLRLNQKTDLGYVHFHRQICDLFCSQATPAIEALIRQRFPATRVTVKLDPQLPLHPMCCEWSQSRRGGACFTFSTFPTGHLLNVVMDRWLSLFPLFCEVERGRKLEGTTALNFNDTGISPGLAMCGNSPAFILLPDSSFFSARGYAVERKYFARNATPWAQRSPRAFWRGSSLGQKNLRVLEMPRVRLCLIAKESGYDQLDAGFSELLDLSEPDARQLRDLDLVKDSVPWEDLSRHRFHIDLDGHACSYSGLFRKLLSGGLVLKVNSPDDYRQWYYDRLQPWINFVPVRSDLSDLMENIAYCRRHDDVAQRIAKDGRKLALAMTYPKELAVAIHCVAQAFACPSLSRH